jgi:hypothetical protein
MLYLRARWYELESGRFISPDPIIPDFQNPQSLHLYIYSLDNPINYTDPSGKQCTGCRTPGAWAQFELYYRYGIRLERGPSGYLFTEHERLLILEVVSDYANLLGGAETLRRNLALSVIRMNWIASDESFNAYYMPHDKSITLPPHWYIGVIAITPNGRAVIALQPCVEEIFGLPEDSLQTDEIEAKFVLAHEMGHAFHTGNPEALRSFKDNVDLPWSILAFFSPNPIIARNAGRRTFDREVFSDALAAFLYSPALLNQQMLDWIQDDMPGVLR